MFTRFRQLTNTAYTPNTPGFVAKVRGPLRAAPQGPHLNAYSEGRDILTRQLDRKRILIYIAWAFGIAWVGGLALFLTGGIANDLRTSLILTLAYMGAPAIAHILTRLLTGEGWQGVRLRPDLRREWPYWAACWLGPGLLTLLGAAVYFLLFPHHFDPTLGRVRELLVAAAEQSGQTLPELDPWTVIAVQVAQAMLISPLLNALPTFGEEFGWRAYLQPKLMVLGARKGLLLTGLIWGVWHWPIIAMGHNYGIDYPGAPWTGLLMTLWFTLVIGVFFGWAARRAGSVWPAVIGHGALNGIASLGLFLAQGDPNPLLGPLPVGLIGSVGFALVALLILWRIDGVSEE